MPASGCGSDDESVIDGDSSVDGDSESVQEDADEDFSDSDIDAEADGDADAIDSDAETIAETRCSNDSRYLEIKEGTDWRQIDCWEQSAGYCRDNVCVPNWIPTDSSVEFSACADDPHAVAYTLAEKATHMDKVMERAHVHPDHGLVAPLLLKDDYYTQWASANGKTIETMSEADYLAAEEDAGFDDVKEYYPGANDGLFTSIYVASQVFRYAATSEQQALDNIKLTLGGTYRQLLITGTPGTYTRMYINPEIQGFSCPENPCNYWPDNGRDEVDKSDDRMVRIENGCVQHYGNGEYVSDEECTGEWISEDICGLDEYNGYCWLDNVSKDEYTGHMMTAALAYKLVDDPEVKAIAVDILDKVIENFIANDLSFIDHDGVITEHGEMWAYTNDGYPGFHAVLDLSWILAGAVATGREDFLEYYEDCLLKEGGPLQCSQRLLEDADTSYMKHLEEAMLLYVGKNACGSNWNNFSMAFISMFHLLWNESDPERRARYQAVLENHMIREDDNFRDIIRQKNAMYNFIYASMRDNRSGMDVQAVNDAICQLQQFPISKADADISNTQEDRPPNPKCKDRNGTGYLADTPQEIWQRCPQTNVWWSCPYYWDNCSRNPLKLHPGSDYLFTYWMGRYFKFIGENF